MVIHLQFKYYYIAAHGASALIKLSNLLIEIVLLYDSTMPVLS